MSKNVSKKNQRTCGECTECCRWLSGTLQIGESVIPFYPGRPCHFVSTKGCTIYSSRPHDPCATYKCGWLENPVMFPEWLKPSLSKIIASKLTTTTGIEYYRINECGQKIDSTALNYLILFSLNNFVNLNIQVGGGWSNYGSAEFLRDIEVDTRNRQLGVGER